MPLSDSHGFAGRKPWLSPNGSINQQARQQGTERQHAQCKPAASGLVDLLALVKPKLHPARLLIEKKQKNLIDNFFVHLYI